MAAPTEDVSMEENENPLNPQNGEEEMLEELQYEEGYSRPPTELPLIAIPAAMVDDSTPADLPRDQKGNVLARYPDVPPMPQYNFTEKRQYVAVASKLRGYWNYFPADEIPGEKQSAVSSASKRGEGAIKVTYPPAWKGDIPWEQWYARFQAAVNSEEHPPSDLNIARKIFQLLDGEPFVWIHAKFSRELNSGTCTKQMLVDELEAAPFKQAEDIPVLRQQWREIRMIGQDKDSYEKYATCFMKILAKLDPQPDPVTVCDQFIANMHNSLKKEVLNEAPVAPGRKHSEWSDFTALQKRARQLWDVLCTTKQVAREEHGRQANPPKNRNQLPPRPAQSKPPGKKGGKGAKQPPTDPRWAISDQPVLNTEIPDKDVQGNPITAAHKEKAKAENTCIFCLRKNHKWMHCRTLRGKSHTLASASMPSSAKKRRTHYCHASTSRFAGREGASRRDLATEAKEAQEVDWSAPQDLDLNDLSTAVNKYVIQSEVPRPDSAPIESHAWTLKLEKDMVDYLCKIGGLTPTLDASPSPAVKVVDSGCSDADPFYERTLAQNECVWMCLPNHSKTITRYLDHYLAQKALDPSISGIFLLPDLRTNKSVLRAKELFDQIYHVAPYARVWARLGPKEKKPYTDNGMLVLVDRGATPPHAGLAAALQDQVYFTLPATVAGTNARLATLSTTGSLDTCFSGEALININLVRHMGLTMQDVSHTAVWGDGSPLKAYGETTFKLSIEKFSCRVRALVVDLAQNFDLLLGETWMKRYGTVLDYQSHAVTLRKGKKAFTIKLPGYKRSRKHVVTRPIVSAAKLHKHLRTAQEVYVCHVRERAEGSSTEEAEHPDIVKLKQDLADAFKRELPDHPGQAICPNEVIPIPEGMKPPYQGMYRHSPAEREEIHRQVTELLSQHRIQPSTSPYGSPVLFVQKPDGSLRMCIDFRRLNKITVRNKYPIPRIDDLLDALGSSKVFSTLDLKQGYHQLRLPDSDIPKTAFNTPFGHYEYVVIPFGLTNAPAAFQQYMNDLLRPYLGSSCLVYLDDIIVFSKTHEEHIRHLREVITTLRDNDLYLHPDKCVFLAKDITYLGHVITPDGLKADPRKTDVVQNWPEPKDKSDIRSFLGLCNYFRRFVSNYSRLALPLTRLTREAIPWKWGNEQQEAFKALKQALVSPPVLAMPDFTKPFTVECDASDYALGGILLQNGRPVAYESRTLSPAEQNYTTQDKECLAVVHCYSTWRCYLEGLESTCITDHHPLTFLLDQPKLNRRQARWLEFLASFRPHIVYRPGEKNPADPLSRLCAGRSQQQPHTQFSRVRGGTVRVARACYKPASSRGCLVAAGEGKHVHVPAPVTREVLIQGYASDPWFHGTDFQKSLTRTIREEDGLYFQATRLVIPAGLREAIMADCHNPPYVGHMGMTKTLDQVRRRFWWPTWKQDVTQFVRECADCQRNKALSGKPYGLLQPLPIPESAWESVSIDFVTGLPLSDKGHDTLIVYMDRLTKMVHLVPTTKHYSAESCAEAFCDNVFRLHGLPKEFVSDRDKVWTADFSRELYSQLGIKQCLTTAYHPESDGQVERANKIVQQVLRNYAEPSARNWDRLLGVVEFAINCAKQQSTGHSPFQLVYGYNPPHPLDRQLEALAPRQFPILPKYSTPAEFKRTLEALLSRAKLLIKQAQDRQKTYADTQRSEVPEDICVGKKVLLSTRNLRLLWTGTPKFMPRYVGPFQIVEQVNPTAFRLELPENMSVHNVFHVSLLKPYHDSGRYQPPPLPVFVENQPEFHVESILAHRSTAGYEIQYLIQWTGQGPEHNTWENESDLTCDGSYHNSALTQYWLNTPRNFPENLTVPSTKRRVTRKRARH